MKNRLFDLTVEVITAKFLRTQTSFEANVSEELKYLRALEEPYDDIERSYRQFQCQCFLRKKAVTFLFNVVSAFIVPFYIVYCLFKKKKIIKSVDAVYSISINDKTIIPTSLKERYPIIHITNEYDGFLLTIKDLIFLFGIIHRYPFSAYFVLKNLIKISIYRYFITAYCPKIIAINSEFSCCSSIMTKYCEEQAIEHINIMHGEKLFYIRDSFFRFTKCYVWDEFYVELFKKLRANRNEFIVEKPQSLVVNVNNVRGKIPIIDFKYMLFENTQLASVANSLSVLKDKGFSVKVRPHPAYSDMTKVNNIFESEDVEDCCIPIQMSIANSKHVVSLYSTVLYQAYLNGIDYVIDDINYSKEYEKLKELNYILISKPHKNLSDVIHVN